MRLKAHVFRRVRFTFIAEIPKVASWSSIHVIDLSSSSKSQLQKAVLMCSFNWFSLVPALIWFVADS